MKRIKLSDIKIKVRRMFKRTINLKKKDTNIIASLNKISKAACKIENGCEEKDDSDIRLYDEIAEIHNAVAEIWNTVMKC